MTPRESVKMKNSGGERFTRPGLSSKVLQPPQLPGRVAESSFMFARVAKATAALIVDFHSSGNSPLRDQLADHILRIPSIVLVIPLRRLRQVEGAP